MVVWWHESSSSVLTRTNRSPASSAKLVHRAWGKVWEMARPVRDFPLRTQTHSTVSACRVRSAKRARLENSNKASPRIDVTAKKKCAVRICPGHCSLPHSASSYCHFRGPVLHVNLRFHIAAFRCSPRLRFFTHALHIVLPPIHFNKDYRVFATLRITNISALIRHQHRSILVFHLQHASSGIGVDTPLQLPLSTTFNKRPTELLRLPRAFPHTRDPC